MKLVGELCAHLRLLRLDRHPLFFDGLVDLATNQVAAGAEVGANALLLAIALVFDLVQAVADGLFERDRVVTRGRLARGHQHGAFRRRPGQADRLGGALAVQLLQRRLQPLPDGDRLIGLGRHTLGERRQLRLLLLIQLACACSAVGLQLGEFRLNLPFQPANLLVQIAFRAGDGAVTRILIHVGDDVLGEIEHALQVAWADIEQQPQPAGHALDIPDVGNRARQLDMAHALAADAAVRHLDAAFITDDALVANALILAAGALPVPLGAENALTEQTVPLRTQRAIVDRFRFGDFTVRPVQNLLR